MTSLDRTALHFAVFALCCAPRVRLLSQSLEWTKISSLSAWGVNFFENNNFVEERGDEIQINISPAGENSGSLSHAININILFWEVMKKRFPSSKPTAVTVVSYTPAYRPVPINVFYGFAKTCIFWHILKSSSAAMMPTCRRLSNCSNSDISNKILSDVVIIWGVFNCQLVT